MTFRPVLMMATATALLAACATQPNNPNYQYSTKYKGAQPSMLASNQTVKAAPVTYAQTTPVSYAPSQATYTRVDEGCLQAGTPVPCYPQEFTTGQTEAYIQSPYEGPVNVILATSETPRTMTDRVPAETIGTPGYHAVQNIDTDDTYPEAQVQMSEPATESVPAVTMPVTIDSDPMSHTENYRSVKPGNLIEHRIVEGDTVYSMSRRLCVPMDEIVRINELDESYSLRVDDIIRLPASRC